MHTERAHLWLAGLAVAAVALAVTGYLVTGRGHFFALSTFAVGYSGWRGGRRPGLVAACLMASISTTIMLVQRLDLVTVARDNVTFWIMCAVIGGGIGHLSDVNRKLRDAYNEIRVLRGFLPICASCKSVRDDAGYWREVEDYLGEHSDLSFTHGLCPPCAEEALRDSMIEPSHDDHDDTPLPMHDDSRNYPAIRLH